MTSEDTLHYLPHEKWSELQNTFKSDWPTNISGYSLLETQMDLKNKGYDYGFKVYCPFGNVWNGMVAINLKCKLCEIIILTPNKDTKKLEEALSETKILNWPRPMMVPFAPPHVTTCLERVVSGRNVELQCHPSEVFLLERHSPPFTDTSLPPNITFGHLSHEHLDLINSTWPHRYPSSEWYFKLLIDTKSSYALYLGNKPISWMFFSEVGTLTHVFTLEGHRKKGYAALLLKIICNKLLAEGKDIFVYCVTGNVNACNLYKKAGFKNCDGVAWCYLDPY